MPSFMSAWKNAPAGDNASDPVGTPAGGGWIEIGPCAGSLLFNSDTVSKQG